MYTQLKPFWPGSRNSASLAVNVQSDGGPPLMEATSLFPLSELATTVLPTPLDNEVIIHSLHSACMC